MTVELDVLKRLRLYEEPFGSYGVDGTGTLANFIDLPIIEGSVKYEIGQEEIDPKLAQQFIEGRALKVAGRRSSSLSFGLPLHSHGVALNGVNTAPTTTTWGMMRLLKIIFGATNTTATAGARTVQAGSTTSTVNVTAGRGADFSAGDAIAVRVGTNATAIEAREVLSTTANSVTVVEQFSAAPVTGADVLGCVTVYTIEDPQSSAQFVLEGAEADMRLAFYGMQGTPKLTLPVGSDQATISFDLKGCDWTRMASGSLAAASNGFLSPFVPVFNELHYTTVSGSTVARTVVDQSAQSIDPALMYAPVRSGAGQQTILRMRRQRQNPAAKASFTTIFDDSRYEADRLASTTKRMDLQLGNIPGSTILASCRAVEVVDVKDAVHESGIGGQQISLEALINSNAAAALTRSVVALHFF